jgi:dephospho-CoA kinase
VTEVPLLYESGSDERFDKVVVVTAREDVRRERANAVIDEREHRLLPDEEKAARADYAFSNDGSLDELDAFVKSVMDDLTR